MVAREKQTKEFESQLFGPLIRDLQKLESGIIVNGELVKAGVVIYSGDNLGKYESSKYIKHTLFIIKLTVNSNFGTFS